MFLPNLDCGPRTAAEAVATYLIETNRALRQAMVPDPADREILMQMVQRRPLADRVALTNAINALVERLRPRSIAA